MEATSHPRVAGLDTIRFIAALVVFFHHFSPILIPSSLEGIPWLRAINSAMKVGFSGPAAVVVFFVISGFCIHFPFRAAGPASLPAFYARRWMRICLPMAAAMVLSQLMGYDMSLLNLAVLWSLVAELIYYSLYPFIRLLALRVGWMTIILLSFVGSYGVVFGHEGHPLHFHSFGNFLNWIVGLPAWLLGCLLAERYTREGGASPTAMRVWAWRALIVVVAIGTKVVRFSVPIGFAWTLPAFSLLVFAWLQVELEWRRHHPPLRLFEKLGEWSYSLYLMHCGIAMGLLNLMGWDMRDPWAVAAVTPLVLLGSWIFFQLVERPSHRLARRVGASLEGPLAQEASPPR